MNKKYQIHNQLTGHNEVIDTFEQAVVRQAEVRSAYIASIENSFSITVLVEQEDGSWQLSLSDAEGNPIKLS
jgi:hypothetical protein